MLQNTVVLDYYGCGPNTRMDEYVACLSHLKMVRRRRGLDRPVRLPTPCGTYVDCIDATRKGKTSTKGLDISITNRVHR